MRASQWFGRACFIIAGLWILLAWYYVWSEHHREVKRLRYVWGPDADVPTFNPLSLVNFATMTDSTVIGYGFAVLFVCIGLVCRFHDRRRHRSRTAS